MSDPDRYYKIGQERGSDGKSTSLGVIHLANKEEERAAQRGWEAGQSAREHAAALEKTLEATGKGSDSSSDYSYSGGLDYSASSESATRSTSSSSSLLNESLVVIAWTGGSYLVATACVSFMQMVTTFSFVWWILALIVVACVPGIIAGAIALAAIGLVLIVILLILTIILWLIGYFVQNPI